jgi:hypothetical protein
MADGPTIGKLAFADATRNPPLGGGTEHCGYGCYPAARYGFW